MSRDELIRKILEYEWEMFQEVNKGGLRAACQDNPETFTAMRMAHYVPWSDEALASWLQDLAVAGLADRNLVEQKYIRMMEHTEPERFEELEHLLYPVSQKISDLSRALLEKLLAQDIALSAEYPRLTSRGRPVMAEYDSRVDTSVETYQLGELLTYSENTLSLLLKRVRELEGQRKSFVEEVLKATVKSYGFLSLEDAEAALEFEW